MANDDNLTLNFSWCSPTLTSKYFSKQLGLHLGSQSSQTFGPQYWGFQTVHWLVWHKNANDTGVFTTVRCSFGCPAAGPCAHKLCFTGLLVQKLLAGRLGVGDSPRLDPLWCHVLLPDGRCFPYKKSYKIHTTTTLNHIEQSYCFEVEW